ncbi:MAG: DUF3458 domain-containing protein, partial [Alphaproteobacteria bacterium]
GLEYDLDLFNIVAVSHFNAGAMENKSLNIFNDAALLASPDTATDANYENIEETVAHEYFHNYSGDRVTLRDWFELSLKEGFTVFRHEEFACDTHSRPVRRIDQVSYLKMYQFPEDDGPLAHPVRPDSYHEIENFYTVTVYEKGAELIRMQQALLGKEIFFKACALYFKRHDGQAVTIDDFVRAMEDASGRDLTAFKRWYSTAGRPRVRIETHYDEAQKIYTVRMTQSHKTAREPFVIPMVYGLVGPDGRDMRAGTLVFDKTVQEFVFEHVPHRPVLSVNRYFTAPIDVDITYSDADRMHLMMYDSDLVNRFEVGAEYVLERLADMVKCGADKPDETILKVIQTYLTMEQPDKAFIARGIALPAPEEIADRLDVVKPADVLRVHQMMRQAVADTYRDKMLEIYRDNQSKRPYSPDSAAAAGRAVKNVALGYLALTDQADLVFKQYRSADNLTDKLAALSILVRNALPEAAEALEDFYRRYETEDLVLNKWFAVQARAESEQALETVKRLVAHPKFDYKNPNKVRAVVGAFSGNLAGFHASDGSGYRWYAEQVLRVDKLNPNLSARLLTQFSKYKRFDDQT